MEKYSSDTPIYELEEGIVCYNSAELGQALVHHWEIGIEQLYEKNLTDKLKQYDAEKASVINLLMIHKFPGNRDAGLMAAAATLNPNLNGIWWKGVCYADIREMAWKIREAMPNFPLELVQLLESGGLSYYLNQTGYSQEAKIAELVEQTAAQNSKVACAQFLFRVLPEEGYRYAGRELKTLEHYIDYLGEQGEHLGEVLYQTFTDSYFIVWLQEQGYGAIYAEWKEYFYTSNVVRNNRELIGNTMQLLERICESKKNAISHMLITYLKTQPEYWVKEHLDYYTMDENMENLLGENFESVEYFPEYTVTQLLQLRLRLKEYCQELRREFMNNAVLYQFNIYDGSAYRITSGDIDAYFVLDEEDEYVPVGWLKNQESVQKDHVFAKNGEKFVIDALTELDEVQNQAVSWQSQMKQDMQQKEAGHKIPGKLAGIPGILLGILVIIAAICVLQIDSDWTLAMVTDVLCIVNMLLALVCIYKSVKQLRIRTSWNRMKEAFLKVTDYTNKIAQIQSDLKNRQLNIGQEENNILYKTQINKPSVNYATEIKVEHAVWGQQRKHLALKQKAGMFSWILMITVCVSVLISVGLNWKNLMDELSTTPVNSSHTVETKSENSNAESTEETVKYRVNVARANVRTGPGTDYEVYDTYSEGTILSATGNEESDGQRIWYEIELQNGDLVWISETTVTKEN